MVLNLDLINKSNSVLRMKQNDDRTITINVFENGAIYPLTGASITLKGKNSRGEGFTQSTNITISDNKAIIKLNRDFTRVNGRVNVEATISKNGNSISTFTFFIDVDQGVLEGASNIVNGVAQDIIEVLDGKILEATKVKNDTEELILGGGAATKGEVNIISETTIINNISNTNYKAGDRFDNEKLRLIQTQVLGDVIWKLKNNTLITFTFIGDSLTYGHDISSADKRNPPTEILPDGTQHVFTRAGKTIPEAFGEALNIVYPNKVNVINRGYSGDYCSRSLTRWNEKHNGDISFIMLGTNDSRSASCPYTGNVKEYIKWYEQLIVRELLWGKAVILLKSPRTLQANDMRVQSFSLAIDNLGQKYNCPVIDMSNFISSYHIDIWSDDTVENTNNIRTHFTSKGYDILGKRLASLFVGDTLLNKKSVLDGSVLLMREQVDGCKYINNILNLEVNKAYTPQERTVDKSIIARFGNGSKMIYSFYTEQDDMYIIPTIYLYANASFKLSLDFGIEQPRHNLTTKFVPATQNGAIIKSEFIISTNSNQLYNKDVLIKNNIEPLLVSKRGWHTLLVESDNCVFSGLEFISFFNFDYCKNKFNYVNEGGLFSIRYDSKYADLIGTIDVLLDSNNKSVEIPNIPLNFRVLNRFAMTVTKDIDCVVNVYTENNLQYIQILTQNSLNRTVKLNFRLFGYYV